MTVNRKVRPSSPRLVPEVPVYPPAVAPREVAASTTEETAEEAAIRKMVEAAYT
jgi:hypothetical protein